MFWNDVPRSIDMVLLGFLDVGPDVIGWKKERLWGICMMYHFKHNQPLPFTAILTPPEDIQ